MVNIDKIYDNDAMIQVQWEALIWHARINVASTPTALQKSIFKNACKDFVAEKILEQSFKHSGGVHTLRKFK